ncbi:MAG: carbohydrate binding domain-containing protein [Bacteroidaceae bacterium]|nr:carbohydrate binding domain-containing protein [Bacteroidaceae bacterium]
MRLLTSIAALALAVALPLCANEPDSVYLFSYNPNPAQGLSFAYSADGRTWTSVADGAAFVKSDYGTWGAEKKMHRPVLARQADGTWQLTFEVNHKTNQYAIATSPDLIHWKPQDYPYVASREVVQQLFDDYEQNFYQKAVVNGREFQGCVNRVSFAEVQAMQRFQEAASLRGRQNSESLADDATRFSALKNKYLRARVQIDGTCPKAISDKLIGIFFEDINYSADGGLYAELIQNRDFEYSERDWNATTAWHSPRPIEIATDQPLHPNNPHYAVLSQDTLWNEGWDGIVVEQGKKYDFSMFVSAGGQKQDFVIQLVGSKGTVLAKTVLKTRAGKWQQYSTVLTAIASDTKARLVIVPQKAVRSCVDMISLFPQQTFRGRKNGMRPDLAQVLADLHPRFMRFPGGCVAHGDGLGNMYHWKETIGPLWERKPQRNIWGYHQSRGIGYFEFFQFCEDIGCEPLPVVPAAVPCQNSSTGGGGQQGGIPFGPEFEQYKQDLLDLIEWANGDPKTSKWAKMRADAGHPKPFNLKYLGIGNEDLISEVFTERYLPLIQAVKERYPEITVCGTTGPFFEGSDYEQGWRLAKENKIDMVDEHYYVSPGWYIHNQHFYDQYDRSASKVYLGEYASHGPGRKSTIETALTCAMHICNLERNGDVVVMSSYAPLLAKNRHTQWNPDLIYFDNTQVYPTVDYFVQKMCGQSQGNQYLPSTLQFDLGPDANRRLAVSTVRDTATGKTYVKLVNLLPEPVEFTLDFQGVDIPQGTEAGMTVLSGEWNSQDARPGDSLKFLLKAQAPVTIPAYAFAVIEF